MKELKQNMWANTKILQKLQDLIYERPELTWSEIWLLIRDSSDTTLKSIDSLTIVSEKIKEFLNDE